ncbi:ROK family protein [Neobacillus pocheonensis]|uniref:ROK family protein n=1 Tax=Neobacillus pocheonensis TaxID=363869 RepID=UPI003D29C4B1
MDHPVVIGMDIGGTKTLIGLVDSQGKIIAKKQFPTNISSKPEEHLMKCINVSQILLEQNKISENFVLGMGVNVPGLADSRNGILTFAPYAGWKNVKVREIIQPYWSGKPVLIANDVNACALGELLFGKGKNIRDFLWITISTGIGGGVIVNRQLVEGNTFIAGEIGHFVVEWENGNQCSCGNRGCLEAYSSGTAIANQAKIQIESNIGAELAHYLNKRKLFISAETVARAAYEGIKSAKEIYRNAGTHLGRALSYAIILLNPGAIIIGGGVSQSFDLLEPSIREVLETSVISEKNHTIPIFTTGLGYEAGLVGAASLVYLNEDSIQSN